MAINKGKSVVTQVSTDDAAYNTVANLNDVSMTVEGKNVDVSVFADNYVDRLQTLKDVKYSLKGFYDTADTTGQVVIRTALLGASDLYVKYLPDGTNGFKQKVVVASMDFGSVVDGVVEVTFSLEGAGDMSITP